MESKRDLAPLASSNGTWQKDSTGKWVWLPTKTVGIKRSNLKAKTPYIDIDSQENCYDDGSGFREE